MLSSTEVALNLQMQLGFAVNWTERVWQYRDPIGVVARGGHTAQGGGRVKITLEKGRKEGLKKKHRSHCKPEGNTVLSQKPF